MMLQSSSNNLASMAVGQNLRYKFENDYPPKIVLLESAEARAQAQSRWHVTWPFQSPKVNQLHWTSFIEPLFRSKKDIKEEKTLPSTDFTESFYSLSLSLHPSASEAGVRPLSTAGVPEAAPRVHEERHGRGGENVVAAAAWGSLEVLKWRGWIGWRFISKDRITKTWSNVLFTKNIHDCFVLVSIFLCCFWFMHFALMVFGLRLLWNRRRLEKISPRCRELCRPLPSDLAHVGGHFELKKSERAKRAKSKKTSLQRKENVKASRRSAWITKCFGLFGRPPMRDARPIPSLKPCLCFEDISLSHLRKLSHDSQARKSLSFSQHFDFTLLSCLFCQLDSLSYQCYIWRAKSRVRGFVLWNLPRLGLPEPAVWPGGAFISDPPFLCKMWWQEYHRPSLYISSRFFSPASQRESREHSHTLPKREYWLRALRGGIFGLASAAPANAKPLLLAVSKTTRSWFETLLGFCFGKNPRFSEMYSLKKVVPKEVALLCLLGSRAVHQTSFWKGHLIWSTCRWL